MPHLVLRLDLHQGGSGSGSARCPALGPYQETSRTKKKFPGPLRRRKGGRWRPAQIGQASRERPVVRATGSDPVAPNALDTATRTADGRSLTLRQSTRHGASMVTMARDPAAHSAVSPLVEIEAQVQARAKDLTLDLGTGPDRAVLGQLVERAIADGGRSTSEDYAPSHCQTRSWWPTGFCATWRATDPWSRSCAPTPPPPAATPQRDRADPGARRNAAPQRRFPTSA
ncbi:hypothetical protein BH24ACT1_BH24ACT1_05970 [soil metagenome]